MIDCVLTEPWSKVLPFTPLEMNRVFRFSKNHPYLQAGDLMLFPKDGRLSIIGVLPYAQPSFLFSFEKRLRDPFIAYYALYEFRHLVPVSRIVWTWIRKRICMRMLVEDDVNFITRMHVKWRLKHD